MTTQREVKFVGGPMDGKTQIVTAPIIYCGPIGGIGQPTKRHVYFVQSNGTAAYGGVEEDPSP